MTPTLRRLNDRERYWGLTWPAWIAVGIAAGVLYGAVRVSPLGVRATITLVVLILAFSGMVMAGVSGQALSPGRQLAAIVRYHRTARRYRLPDVPGKRGLVLDRRPPDPDQSAEPEGFGEVLA